MIPQPFPPFPPFLPFLLFFHRLFLPFLLSPFLLLPFHLFFLRLFLRTPVSSAACWLRCGFILCTNPSFRTFRTPVPIVVYQPCPSPRSVPQKPLPCTNRALHPFPYRRSPSRVPTVSLTSFCAANQPFLNRTLLTIFRRMTVICFCLHLMEIMSPLRTVPNQACDGSARWMNGSRSGVFGPDPTSEPCLNLSRHLARSRTL